ncbi:MAG: 4-hydroxybenzoate octaprenyltransferase [Gammaproteobacteria bacterium]|nr:4-hydroxybenzoate octaprenyltransferase [Gammaproteobacteria bacterium]MCP5424646.1 4-hydroxybenzoate octaprenyltransferase [Gammaproteobacteria bacterium]
MTSARLAAHLGEYALLMRLDRPIGSFLLLWPTLWALWLAGRGQPTQKVVIVFLLGVVLMRSAGCVINDIADRHLDPLVARTRQRPLAAQRVSVREAMGLFLGLCGLAFVLVLSLNALTVWLSLIGLVLATVYPFMKRWHHLPQVHLGAAFGWSIPMAFAALTDTVPGVGWLLFATNVVWSVVYDTMYAMVDRDDDLLVGAKSTAILFGEHDKRIIGCLQGLLLAMLIVVGVVAGLGWAYYLGVFAASWFALYQQYLIRDREPAECFKAFMNNNWFGLAVFCGIVLDFLPTISS